MSDYNTEQLRQLSEIMKEDENIRNAFSKYVIRKAEEKNISIEKILDELPSIIEWNCKNRIYQIQYEMKKPSNIDKYAHIEFVKIYEKEWALCGSTVVLKINDQEIEFHRILGSGGSVSWGDEEEINIGPWCVRNLPEYLEKYEEEITKVINDNVDWGCCGGCI